MKLIQMLKNLSHRTKEILYLTILMGGIMGLSASISYVATVISITHEVAFFGLLGVVGTVLSWAILFIALAIVYMLPTMMVADNKYVWVVLLINAVLGWTIIGWIGCLIYAIYIIKGTKVKVA